MNDPIIIIVPGLYRNKKNNINQKEQELVRVFKEDPERPGYQITENNGRISNYEINSNYELFSAGSSANNIKKTLPKSIFAGISNKVEVKDTDDDDDVEGYVPISEEEKIKPLPEFNHTPAASAPTPTPLNLDIELIQKCNIDKINQKNIENNLPLVQKLPIYIGFETIINYDLDKITQSIELLDLNTNIIAKYLTQKILENNNIEKLIQYKVMELLKQKPTILLTSVTAPCTTIPSESIVEISMENPTIPTQPIYSLEDMSYDKDKEKELFDGIAEIDNLISKYVKL